MRFTSGSLALATLHLSLNHSSHLCARCLSNHNYYVHLGHTIASTLLASTNKLLHYTVEVSPCITPLFVFGSNFGEKASDINMTLSGVECAKPLWHEPQPSWSAFREASFGVGKLEFGENWFVS